MLQNPFSRDHPSHVQELSESRRLLCATVVLDRGTESLEQRVSNKLYEGCRAGTLEIQGFPDYKPLLAALQQAPEENVAGTYSVTVKRLDKLVVLSSFAEKFLSSEEFKDETNELISAHNKAFNEDGDYLAEPENTRTLLVACAHVD